MVTVCVAVELPSEADTFSCPVTVPVIVQVVAFVDAEYAQFITREATGVVTVTLAVPCFVVSNVLVAVTAAVPAPDGVNNPDVLMLPPIAVQVTVCGGLFVPCTVAAHWLVCAVVIAAGEQLAVTPVTVGCMITPPAAFTAIAWITQPPPTGSTRNHSSKMIRCYTLISPTVQSCRVP
jgi:hypothetical protein